MTGMLIACGVVACVVLYLLIRTAYVVILAALDIDEESRQ